MTKPMNSTDTYRAKHVQLVQEVRSAPVESAGDPEAGQTVHCLLSASMALCAMPPHMFGPDDRTDILNVIKNLGMLARRIG